MSAVSVLNITALKGVSAETVKLRWVQNKKAWYQSDPNSAATGDDDFIVTPTAGTGRWIKQQAALSTNTILQVDTSKTSSFTASPNTHYIVDLTNAPNEVCTVTLPASPLPGTKVDVTYASATNLLKKIQINRNGNLLQGIASNLELYTQYSYLYLTFVNVTFGWLVTSDRPLMRYQAAQTFNKPPTTNQAQNGIFNYLGTELGTASYINPTFEQATPTPRPARVQVFTYGNPSGYNTTKTSSATACACLNKTTSALATGTYTHGDPRNGFLNLSFYNSHTLNPIYVRLIDIYIEWVTTNPDSDSTHTVPGISIFGTNTMTPLSYTDLATINTTNNATSTAGNNANYAWNFLVDWTPLVRYTRPGNASLTAGFYTTSNPLNAEFIPVNSTDFYSHFYIKNNRISSGNTAMGIHTLEFYGEVIV